MTGSKQRKKVSKKTSQFVIRIDPEERDQFVELCDELDTTAAREIRHFMRKFVTKHKKSSRKKS